MTVGFSDLANFMRACEKLGDEQTVEILQEAYQAAGDAIVAQGGKIHKYIGDMIMFSFTNAAKARKAAEEISHFSKKIGSVEIYFNTGLATGEVLLGKIGHPSAQFVDVIGRTVNHAALLQMKASKEKTRLEICPDTK